MARLFVGNLPFDTTEAQIKELIAGENRTVRSVKIITDKETGRSRGFAFVDLDSDEEAKSAIFVPMLVAALLAESVGIDWPIAIFPREIFALLVFLAAASPPLYTEYLESSFSPPVAGKELLMMNRREMLVRGGAAAATLGLAHFPLGWMARADGGKQHVLVFTRSQGFEHSVVKRGKNNELSLAERIVTGLGKKHGFEVTCTKDGREFLPETISKYDAFLFETTMDLTKEGGDNNPPMPPEGKKALLKAIADGKGFVGCHCASDTFHSPGARDQNQDSEHMDPYIAMLGGEFIVHGSQQKADQNGGCRVDVPAMEHLSAEDSKEG